MIDQLILGQTQRNKRKLSTAYIDYQKAFDSVPHTWLMKSLQLHKVNSKIIMCFENVMRKWSATVYLRNNKKAIETEPIQIQRGIFQGDALSSLWFCLALHPLSYLLNETPTGFNIRDNRRTLYNISHLMYMDDIKLYAPSRSKLLQMLQTVKDFSEDIQMSFGLDKCRILDINSSSSTEAPEN